MFPRLQASDEVVDDLTLQHEVIGIGADNDGVNGRRHRLPPRHIG